MTNKKDITDIEFAQKVDETIRKALLFGTFTVSKTEIGKKFAKRFSRICKIPDSTETSQGKKFWYNRQLLYGFFKKPEYIGVDIVEVYYHLNSMNVVLVTSDGKKIGLGANMIEAVLPTSSSWTKAIKSWTNKENN